MLRLTGLVSPSGLSTLKTGSQNPPLFYAYASIANSAQRAAQVGFIAALPKKNWLGLHKTRCTTFVSSLNATADV